jgi:hypothetical protein
MRPGTNIITASTSERRLPSFTAHKRKLEDQRSELSGARLPGHMVSLIETLVLQQELTFHRQLWCSTSTIQTQPPPQVLRRIG